MIVNVLDKTLAKSRDTMPNIAVFNLTVRQIDALKLPKHSGSMLRGAFGHALRELCCITDLADCSQCPLNQACRYTYIFETQLLISPIVKKHPILTSSYLQKYTKQTSNQRKFGVLVLFY